MEQARPTEAVQRLVADLALRAAHAAMLPQPRRPRLDPLDPAMVMGRAKLEEAQDLGGALAALTRTEKAALLGDAGGVARLLQLAEAAKPAEAGLPRPAAMAG
jgi:membrane glycosyltransferase